MKKGNNYALSDDDFNDDLTVVDVFMRDKVFDLPIEQYSSATMMNIILENFKWCTSNIESFSRLGANISSIQYQDDTYTVILTITASENSETREYSSSVLC